MKAKYPVAAVVLGITQDAGYPHVGCLRACCAPAWRSPSARHHVACLGLVDFRTRRCWLIDATPDLPVQLHRLKALVAPTSSLGVDAIFLTHGHIGHYTGLMYLGREGMNARRLPVYAMPRMAVFLRENAPWNQLVALQNIELRSLNNGKPVHLASDLTVTPFLVPHRSEYTETVGFLVQGPRACLLYLPDIDGWDQWSESLEEMLGEVDVAYLDGTFFSAAELPPGRRLDEIPHPLMSDTIRRIRHLPPAVRQRVRFIHFNHTNPALHAPTFVRQTIAPLGVRVAVEGERVFL